LGLQELLAHKDSQEIPAVQLGLLAHKDPQVYKVLQVLLERKV